jgi:hypothetical protein
MSAEVREVLVKARDLITPPGNLIAHDASTDDDGNHVRVEDPRAVRFCILGAVWRAMHLREIDPRDDKRFLTPLYSASRHNTLTAIADEGHAAALALFDRAIAEIDSHAP